MTTTPPSPTPPPFDPELAAALALMGEMVPTTLTPEMIPVVRMAPEHMAVNIEHEDAAYSQTEGLALAAKNLHSAAAGL